MCQLSLLVVLFYGLLLYQVKPYLLIEYNNIDQISSLSSFFTIYLTMIILNLKKENYNSATFVLVVLRIHHIIHKSAPKCVLFDLDVIQTG